MHFASGNETLNESDMFCAEFCPTKHPVVLAELDWTDLTFHCILSVAGAPPT